MRVDGRYKSSRFKLNRKKKKSSNFIQKTTPSKGSFEYFKSALNRKKHESSAMRQKTPPSKKQLIHLRESIMAGMYVKKFGCYVDTLKQIETQIVAMLNNSDKTDIMDDHIWIMKHVKKESDKQDSEERRGNLGKASDAAKRIKLAEEKVIDKYKTLSKTKSETNSKTQSETNPKAKSETQPETKSKAKSETKSCISDEDEVKFLPDTPWWAIEDAKMMHLEGNINKEKNPKITEDVPGDFEYESTVWQYKLFGIPTFVGAVCKQVMKPDLVNTLVGDADWMTPQQILLFKACIGSYFLNSQKLWPVFANMDLAYRNRTKSVLEQEETEKSGFHETKINDISQYHLEQMKKVFEISKKPTGMFDSIRKLQFLNWFKDNIKDQGMAVLKAALAGAGPFILKILQQINNTNDTVLPDGTRVRDITDAVFKDVPSMPIKEYNLVKNSLRIKDVYKDNVKPKTLGSASIAEAHLTKDSAGETAIIKFLKPIYAYYFLCECDFLLTVAWKKIRVLAEQQVEKSRAEMDRMIMQSRMLLMFLIKEFVGEFDYESEAKYTVWGFNIYNQPRKGVESARLLDYSVDPFPCIVQSAAPGDSLEKVLKDISLFPKREHTIAMMNLSEIMSNLLKIWFTNLFWGNGFAHADLHPGNIFVPLAKDLKKSIGYKGPVTLIDFGSIVQLSEREQCKLINTVILSSIVQDMTKYIPKRFPTDRGEEKSLGLSEIGDGRYFKDWKTYTRDQQVRLVRITETRKFQKVHAYNKRAVRKFIRAIFDVCNVNDRTVDHSDYLVEQVLDYSNPVDFGGLFLRIVTHARDIGTCTSSGVLMFGRAIAYIGSSLIAVEADCIKRQQCVINGQNVCTKECARSFKCACPIFVLADTVMYLLDKKPGKIKECFAMQEKILLAEKAQRKEQRRLAREAMEAKPWSASIQEVSRSLNALKMIRQNASENTDKKWNTRKYSLYGV